MKLSRTFVVMATGLALTGCGISQVVRDERTIPLAKDLNPMKDQLELGSIYAWPPHASAMVIDGKGNRCVRVAAGARVTGGASELEGQVDALKEIAEGLKLGRKDAVEQAFIRLNSPSQLANILDVVLFHHCIQDSNGTFTVKAGESDWKAKETMKLYQSVIETIKIVYPKEGQNSSGNGSDDEISVGSSAVSPKDGSDSKGSTKPSDGK